MDAKQKARAIAKLYGERISPIRENLSRLSNSDLHAAFIVSSMTYFYSQAANEGQKLMYLNDLKMYSIELDKRKALTSIEVSEQYLNLVAGRQFEDAEDLRQLHPNIKLPELPRIDIASDFNASKPGLYSLTGEKNGLMLRNVNVNSRYFILVVAQCHVARDAASAILGDETLSGAFKKGNAVWLSSAGEQLDIEKLKEWSESFPSQPIAIAYDNIAWMGVDFSFSPTFYFYRDGVVIGKHVGWSPSTGKAKLIELLRLQGVLD
ncbi:hypothetical protein GCM10007862_02350 [Dyella lipolytica]|nr:hypothetical protein GCM10007862_02350 [Dyella lipolytica]